MNLFFAGKKSAEIRNLLWKQASRKIIFIIEPISLIIIIFYYLLDKFVEIYDNLIVAQCFSAD